MYSLESNLQVDREKEAKIRYNEASISLLKKEAMG